MRWLPFPCTVMTMAPLALLACGGDEAPTEPPSTTNDAAITYHRDVRPILEQKCVGCHQDGQIGEGPLDSYGDVVARSTIVEQQVRDRLMPPWHAGKDCNDYRFDPSLTQEEIDLIVGWVDDGTPEGDPADMPPIEPEEQPELSRVDLSLEMPEPYTPDATQSDDYRCFAVDFPGDSTQYVTGIGVHPGNASTVHHVIAYFVGPDQVDEVAALDDADPGLGYTCFGGAGTSFQSTGMLAGWVPGAAPSDLPTGTGIRIEPGTKVILQVHYNMVTWDGEPDRTRLDLRIDDEVDREAWLQFFTNPQWPLAKAMPIPAGDPDVSHGFTAKNIAQFIADGSAFDVYSAGLHMHTRGRTASMRVQHADDSESCLVEIPRWDFNWQGSYGFTQPVRVEPGDAMSIACSWDNSPQNQPIVDGSQMPPQDINWGEGTDDEMCLGTIYMAKVE